MAKKKHKKVIKMKVKSRGIGRPSKYSIEITKKLCDLIGNSDRGLDSIAKELKITGTTVYVWLNLYPEFRERYAHAREAQADYLADQIISIADDSTADKIEISLGPDGVKATQTDHEHIQRSRLRVDARKWKASKLAPKKYGDRLDLTTAGKKIEQVMKTLVIEPASKTRGK